MVCGPHLDCDDSLTAFSFSIGELTRGMLVVDRRDDASAYLIGANRAQAQVALENSQAANRDPLNSATIPTRVGEENDNSNLLRGHGVSCVYGTPGPDVLLKLLLKRVWGVE